MADNVVANSIPVATRAVTYSGDASQNAQVVGLVAFSGSDDAKTAVDLPGDATNGLDVDVTRLPASVVSTANSTTANLGVGAVFTGTSEEVKDYSYIVVSVRSSHVSATDGLSIQQSSDGTNWDILDVYTIAAATGVTFSFQPAARYYRLVYTNGGTLTTSLRIQTVFHYQPVKSSSHRLGDAQSNEFDTEQVGAYMMGFNSVSWDRIHSFGIGSDALSAASHGQGALITYAANAMYNGATWDRVRGDTTNGLDVDVTRLPTDLAIADDAAFTVGTSKVLGSGFMVDEASTDSADEGDIAIGRVTPDRKIVVTHQGHTAGGLSRFKTLDLDETEEDVKTSAGTVYGFYVYNAASTVRYLKWYNLAAASVTVGTTVPVETMPVPPASGIMMSPASLGIEYTVAICVAATTGLADADTGAPGTNDVFLTVWYK